MSKFKSVIIILGSLIIFIVASLATFLGLSYAGAIVTDPINLTFEIQDVEKTYDGTPLMADVCELVDGELINGHYASFEFLGSQTEAGESNSDVRIKIVDEDLIDVTKNYAIKIEQGSLTVNKAPVSIKVEDCSVVYCGDEIFFDNYLVTEGKLVQGHKIKAKTSQKGSINAGVLELELDPMIYDIAGNDVTENYNVEFSVGKLEILPRNLDIKPKDYSKVYDGESLICDEYEILSGSLAYGHFLEVTYKTSNGDTASITNVEESTRTKISKYNIYTYIGEEKVDVTSNYNVNTISEGVFEIKPRPLTLKGEDVVYKYTGKEQSLKDVNTVLYSDGLIHGEEVTVEYETTTCVNVTEEPKGVRIESFEISSGNQNYTVELLEGSISIIKEELTIYYSTIDETYNGVKMGKKSNDYIDSFSSNVDAIKVLVKADAISAFEDKCINAGTYSYHFDNDEIEVVLGGDVVNKNFDIRFVAGVVNIRKQYVDISLNNLSAEYTGNDFTIDASKVLTCNSGDVKVEIGNDVLKEIFKNIKNAGVYTYTVPVEKLKISNATNNKTLEKKNLDIKINSGIIVITKKELRITLDSYDEIYSGKGINLTTDGFTTAVTGVTIPTLKETINEYKNAGVYSYTVSPEDVYIDKKPASENYNVIVEQGTIIIRKKELRIKLDSYDEIYSGQGIIIENNKNGFTTPLTGVAVIIPTLKETINEYKNAGVYSYTVSPEDVYIDDNLTDQTADYKPASENYNVIVEQGTIIIRKKELQIKLAPYDIEYEGTIIKQGNGFEASVMGVEIKTLDSVLAQYKDAGVYSYTINPEDVYVDNKPASENYNVYVIPGKIVIKKKQLTITLNPYDKTYGDPLKLEGKGFIPHGTAKNVEIPTLLATISEFKAVGTYTYTINPEDVLVDGKPASDNYNILVNTGVIVIKKAQLKITLASFTINFGEEYQGALFTPSITTKNVEIPTLSTTISKFKEVGTYTYTINPEDVLVDGKPASDNYNILVNTGVIVIKGASVGAVVAHVENLYAFTADSFDPTLYTQEQLNNLLVIDSFTPSQSGDQIVVDGIRVYIRGNSIIAQGDIKVMNGSTDVTKNYSINFDKQGSLIFMITEE